MSDVLSEVERVALEFIRRHAASIADLLAGEAERAWGRYPTLAASYWRTSAALLRVAAEQAASDLDLADADRPPASAHYRSMAAMREALAAEALAFADKRAAARNRAADQE